MPPDPRTPIEDHPEQDPAEGSREVVEKDLAEQGGKDGEADPGEQAEKKDGS